MQWQLREAKKNFSKPAKLTISAGPQTVTLRVERAVMGLSAEDHDRLKEKKPSLAEFILSGPLLDVDIPDENNRRDRKPSRPPIEF